MFKKILIAIVLFLLLFFILFSLKVTESDAATPEQMNKIYAWNETKPEGGSTVVWKKMADAMIVQTQYRVVEKINYSTELVRILSVVTVRDLEGKIIKPYSIWIDILRVKELLCPDVTQTEQWNLGSYGDLGYVHSIMRMFRLHHPSSGIIFPEWPPGFVSPSWIKPPKEEAQKVYDTEIEFWLKHIASKSLVWM